MDPREASDAFHDAAEQAIPEGVGQAKDADDD
jgi:hypothetical protein